MSENIESKASFARRVSLSRVRIGQLVKEGLPTDDGGAVRIDEALAWMKRRLDPTKRTAAKPITEALSQPTDHDDGPTLTEAKRRHELLKTERTALRLSIERQEAALWTEINAALAGWAAAERDSWLGWCQRVVPDMSAELKVDGALVLTVLRRAVLEHLRELAIGGAPHVGPVTEG